MGNPAETLLLNRLKVSIKVFGMSVISTHGLNSYFDTLVADQYVSHTLTLNTDNIIFCFYLFYKYLYKSIKTLLAKWVEVQSGAFNMDLLCPPANMVSGVGSGSGVQVIDSPLLTQQIEAQRLCIKRLKNENNRLKVRTALQDQEHVKKQKQQGDLQRAEQEHFSTFS